MTDQTDANNSRMAIDDEDPLQEDTPSGWLVLTQNTSVQYIIDALLTLPDYREFNKTELADMADVSRQSVARHIDLLTAVDIVEPVADTSPPRYRFKLNSAVSQTIIAVDSAMRAALEHAEDIEK